MRQYAVFAVTLVLGLTPAASARAEICTSTGDVTYAPRLAHDGSGGVVSWEEGGETWDAPHTEHVAVLGADGTVAGATVSTLQPGAAPARGGGANALVGMSRSDSTGQADVVFQLLGSSAGTARETMLGRAPAGTMPEVAFDGEAFVVVWGTTEGISIVRVGVDGGTIGSTIVWDTPASPAVRVAADGLTTWIAWGYQQDAGSYYSDVRVARFDATQSAAPVPIDLGEGRLLSLAPRDGHFLVLFDTRYAHDAATAVLDAEGLLAGPQTVSYDGGLLIGATEDATGYTMITLSPEYDYYPRGGIHYTLHLGPDGLPDGEPRAAFSGSIAIALAFDGEGFLGASAEDTSPFSSVTLRRYPRVQALGTLVSTAGEIEREVTCREPSPPTEPDPNDPANWGYNGCQAAAGGRTTGGVAAVLLVAIALLLMRAGRQTAKPRGRG